MTPLEVYTYLVLLVLGIGFGALWISRREDGRRRPAE